MSGKRIGLKSKTVRTAIIAAKPTIFATEMASKTHQIMPMLDVVFWTVFLDSGKARQTLSGLRLAQRPTNRVISTGQSPDFSCRYCRFETDDCRFAGFLLQFATIKHT